MYINDLAPPRKSRTPVNLAIVAGTPDKNTTAGADPAGSFSVTVKAVNYDFDKIEAAGQPSSWTGFTADQTADYVKTVEFKNDATITIGDKAQEIDVLHEIGHADEYAKDRFKYFKDTEQDVVKGKPHDAQPAEVYANDYAARQRLRGKRPFNIPEFYDRLDEFVAFSSAYINNTL